MHEALQSVRLTTPTPPARPARRDAGRQAAPFLLNDEPPTEAPAEEAHDEPSREPAYQQLDVGHRLDDEEGQAVDVTA